MAELLHSARLAVENPPISFFQYGVHSCGKAKSQPQCPACLPLPVLANHFHFWSQQLGCLSHFSHFMMSTHNPLEYWGSKYRCWRVSACILQSTHCWLTLIPHPLKMSFVHSFPCMTIQVINTHLGVAGFEQMIDLHGTFSPILDINYGKDSIIQRQRGKTIGDICFWSAFTGWDHILSQPKGEIATFVVVTNINVYSNVSANYEPRMQQTLSKA